ncbi:hypothetical protein CMUS01_12526 [Colletotrichum musicola]|uniref:Uncharacterized protein n=1 Tax=Colletotrichum musicola TaxID=2175873 RepID=A0A8H6JKQ3_9PEZI|nr:hypothetical protein CMUS01_12526 [Colletotrichum musicola]
MGTYLFTSPPPPPPPPLRCWLPPAAATTAAAHSPSRPPSIHPGSLPQPHPHSRDLPANGNRVAKSHMASSSGATVLPAVALSSDHLPLGTVGPPPPPPIPPSQLPSPGSVPSSLLSPAR